MYIDEGTNKLIQKKKKNQKITRVRSFPQRTLPWKTRTAWRPATSKPRSRLVVMMDLAGDLPEGELHHPCLSCQALTDLDRKH